ncbi:MAG: hypothetical protein CSB13_06635, partial [Chloroflexi bacterium]
MVKDANRAREWYGDSIFSDDWFTIAALGFPAIVLVLSQSILFGVFALLLVFVGFSTYQFWDKLPVAIRHRFMPDDAEEAIVEEPIADPEEVAVADAPGSILLGDMDGKAVLLPIASLNHVFIVGMTRYGKTRLALSLVAEFIQKFSSDELKIAFSDAKAISFNVFGRSDHLFAPIASSAEKTSSLIEIVMDEMYRRLALFSRYRDKICTNVDEYFELSGERLPRIVVIFDEVADSIAPSSDAEKNLTTIAKMGLAAGIHLVLITQRPTKIGISHEITSQCQTIMSTYMKNPTEYGSVSKIPQGVYANMKPEKGLFMVFNPDLAPGFTQAHPEYEGWGFMKSRYIPNNVIEGIAIVDANEAVQLPELDSGAPVWGGSMEDKLQMIEALDIRLGRISVDDIKSQFG